MITWADRTRPGLGTRNRPWERTLEVLRTFGSASANELGAFLDLNPGNIRKHLLILEHQGRAQRLDGRQWAPVAESGQSGAA